MKVINAIGLILMLLLSACAVSQQPKQVTTPQPTPQEPEIEEVQVEEEQEETQIEEKVTTTDADISILGKEGFDPAELTISAGSTVTWVNNADKRLTLTFFKDGKFYQNSDVTNPGEKFELTFNEKGSYEYWSVDYGVKAKIAVE